MLFSDYVRPTLCNCLFTAPKRTSTSQWDVKPLAKAITGKYNKTVETKGMPLKYRNSRANFHITGGRNAVFSGRIAICLFGIPIPFQSIGDVPPQRRIRRLYFYQP